MPISDDLRLILAAWLPRTRSERAFPGIKLGPWGPGGRWTSNATYLLRAACLAAGIPPITFEQLRRFHAEQAVASVPFATIAARGIINGSSKAPTIDGKSMRRLTATQYKVLKVLSTAGEEGIGTQEFKAASHYSNPVKI